MDFFNVAIREAKDKMLELYPDFTVGRSSDLMVRGKAFYAIWDEAKGMWSTDEYDVQHIVDNLLKKYADEAKDREGMAYNVKYLRSASSQMWYQFKKFVSQVSDNSHQLDEKLTFANTEVKKEDYVSRRLPYPLLEGDCPAWDELVGTLYSTEERAKIEWIIGAIVSGDAKKIQKFAVFYGPPGSGKGTILNIVEKLFEGYVTAFDAKALGSNGAAFATEVFKDNPLVAIQQDGDLSRIEDNARLNSIISHEMMPMNEKYKPGYRSKVNAFLLMGSNQPVRISDAKSGIIRRLIDIHPTGVKIPENHYNTLMSQIDFELGAIAFQCLETYRSMGRFYYNSYKPLEMMLQTDVFFNFIEAYYDVFKAQDGCTLRQAYTLYKEFCSDTGIDKVLPQYKFREELRNYFDEYRDRATIDGELVRSYYHGFTASKFKSQVKRSEVTFSLVVEETQSLLDNVLALYPAQYHRTTDDGTEIPEKYWTNEERLIDGKLKTPRPSQVCSTTLADIDTSKLHYVKVPEDHIVIDFDLTDENGNKSLERNLEAASVWPATYAELSKGGNGVHLHYIYTGDVSELSAVYSEGIEVKTLLGNSSLRRRVSKCNNIPVSTLNSGLPLKEKKLLADRTIQSEKGLRELVIRNMKKEFHPSTKSSIDFIAHILEEQYATGMAYDLSDMKGPLWSFANDSTNSAMHCLKVVQGMRFVGKGEIEKQEPSPGAMFGEDPVYSSDYGVEKDERLVFYDVEVYSNLFVLCYKFQGNNEVVRMINPTPQDIEPLLKLRLVGFNNRRYDNHILWAAYMGYSNLKLYDLSQKIINNDNNALFASAYSLSWCDIYEFSSKKQGLKKFQIELGIPHKEMDLSWDEPAPEDMWDQILEYCVNDVLSTEVVFESRKQDYVARQILAALSGLEINDTTQKHTAKIIFEGNRSASEQFVYTELDKEFPGYEFEMGKSTYRGEVTGEGGYVYAEPGIYEDVAVLDIASMHPTTLIHLNYFGKYTPNFSALKDARVAIKHGDYDAAKEMLGGKLAPYLENTADADALSYALKIVINIVYGLTSAKFDNPFRQLKNRDNIVAKRGALFMVDLKHAVQEKGFQVVHIKTDSIKIPNATQEIIDFVTDFGKSYGYDFEHEGTYSKFCLVNDAVYIANYGWAEKEKKIGTWEAVGAQFQHPYVFKDLFSGEEILYDDMCETKQVQAGHMYLDFEGSIKQELERVKELKKVLKKEGSEEEVFPEVDYVKLKFVGRTGRFVPVVDSGADLWRIKENKPYAVAGSSGYTWMEADVALAMGDAVDVDMSYFTELSEKAVESIEKFAEKAGISFAEFVGRQSEIQTAA